MTSRAFVFGRNTLGLEFVENDVRCVTQALLENNFQVTVPAQPEVSSELVSHITEFLDSCSYSDTVLVYYTGHAFAPKGELLLLLSNDMKRLNRSTVRLDYLIASLESCNARSKLLVLDCCHALSNTPDWRSTQSDCIKILAASGRLEPAKEIAEYQASFLTYHFCRALTECYYDAIQNGQELTVNSLYDWIVRQAKDYNSRNSEPVPIPKLIGDQGQNFSLASSQNHGLSSIMLTYLERLCNCFSACSKECYGRYPWCRTAFGSGKPRMHYITPRIKFSTNSKTITEKRLDKFVRQWMTDQNQKHLALLGDSGSGKSSACAFISLMAANNCLLNTKNGTIPVYLSMEGLASHNLLGCDIATILRHQLKLDLNSELVDQMVKDGRFLFVLDGFDEICDSANNARILKNLSELDPILLSSCKSILTCRTHYFVDQEQVDEVLLGKAWAGTDLCTVLLKSERGFRIVELQDFSPDEIKQLIRKNYGNRANNIWEQIQGLYNLEDLSKRPILLVLILQTLPNLIRKKSQIDRVEIYDEYTRHWLRREAERVKTNIDIRQKEKFIESLAIDMWDKNVGSINYEALREEIRTRYSEEITSMADLDTLEYDTRNASFLNRDNDGFYKFMHRSFMEYFVARCCVRALKRDARGIEYWDIRWFDKEIAGFISEMLQQKKNTDKIGILASLCLSSSKRTILWNALHILSLIGEMQFQTYVGEQLFDQLIERGENECGAVILRQYCRIIAKFGDREKAEQLIRRIIELVSKDKVQNRDNNNTYLSYYYGQSAACEALLKHLSTEIPKYDRALHIYVLGEIGKKEHVERLLQLVRKWDNTDHIGMAHDAVRRIESRRN